MIITQAICEMSSNSDPDIMNVNDATLNKCNSERSARTPRAHRRSFSDMTYEKGARATRDLEDAFYWVHQSQGTARYLICGNG